jgi:hypothetical protein
MSMDELREYCDRLDAARGLDKANGPVPALPIAEVETLHQPLDPILREPVKPPEGAPMQALNDYYAAKKRWNEQQHG